MIEFSCPTETDTRAAAGRLAALCRPGDVIVLTGALGAGKTAFTSGMADGLGIDEVVNSPSFVIMREYDHGFLPLVHVDVYRIGTLGEFDDLEARERARDGVLVIEWGELVASELGPDRLVVEMTVTEDAARTLRFIPHGAWVERDLAQVAP